MTMPNSATALRLLNKNVVLYKVVYCTMSILNCKHKIFVALGISYIITISIFEFILNIPIHLDKIG